jgi:FHA domain-containing protein
VGILTEFERRLERAIEGVFTKAFRTGLQPVELATRILRDMETNKTVGVDEVWVPNRFVFRLSEEDRQRFEKAERSLRRELEQVVRDGAQQRGWSVMGPPEVIFETDPALKQGDYQCEPSLVEGPTTSGALPAQAPPAPARSASGDPRLILIQNGRPAKAFPLAKERIIIGRLGESDIVLSDPGVSRRHAEVRTQDGRFVIADLGSTNGTMVNESTVGERVLEEGDRITIGKTVLEFRSH